MSLAEAARVLDVVAKTLSRGWSNEGTFRGVARGHRRWVEEASVLRLAQARQDDATTWISHQDAAKIVGCSTHTILRMVRAGKIEKRKVPRATPLLRRSSLDEFARAWPRNRPNDRPAL